MNVVRRSQILRNGTKFENFNGKRLSASKMISRGGGRGVMHSKTSHNGRDLLYKFISICCMFKPWSQLQS